MSRKTTLSDIREIFKEKTNNKSAHRTDTHCYGVVHSVNEDGSYNVILGGGDVDDPNAPTVKCQRMVGAEKHDVVLVLILANGYAVVQANLGGDSDLQESLAHFWYDNQGAHIVSDTSGYRTDLDGTGMSIKKGGTEVAILKGDRIELAKAGDDDGSSYIQLGKDLHSTKFDNNANGVSTIKTDHQNLVVRTAGRVVSNLARLGKLDISESENSVQTKLIADFIDTSQTPPVGDEAKLTVRCDRDSTTGTFSTKVTVDADKFQVNDKTHYGPAQGLSTVSSGTITIGSVTAGSNANGTLTLTKSGYYPFGVVGHRIFDNNGTNYRAMHLYACYLDGCQSGQCTLHYGMRNNSDSTATAVRLEVFVLWAKND